MSKAFTRDDVADEPEVPPSRAPLPTNAPNYVTARGLAALREELLALHGAADEATRARRVAAAAELEARIASASVVARPAEAPGEIRFGATVTVRTDARVERRYQIVGVDEADVARGRVAFVAPLARALLGKRVGDTAVVVTPRGDEELEVIAVAYDEA